MEIVLFLELNLSITHQSCIHSIFLSFFIIFKSFYSFVGIFSYFLNLYVYVNEASVEIFLCHKYSRNFVLQTQYSYCDGTHVTNPNNSPVKSNASVQYFRHLLFLYIKERVAERNQCHG